jgi:YHYH protein
MQTRLFACALSALTLLAAVAAGSSVAADGTPTVIDPKHIPIGDGQTTATADRGQLLSCQRHFPEPTGVAAQSKPWIHSDGTWDATAKRSVAGSVSQRGKLYKVTTKKRRRTIRTHNLPVGHRTGVFPVAQSDPAYRYTHNGAHITTKDLSIRIARYPRLAEYPSCLGTGPVGVTRDGVLLFSALDPYGRDAGAHEVFDACGGHPEGQGAYHRHLVPPCLYSDAKGRYRLVGFALDGLGIYMERDAGGKLLTNADLDSCHGRRSRVKWNGKVVRVYHYVITQEYPYTLGCFRGKPSKVSVVLSGTGSGGAGPG